MVHKPLLLTFIFISLGILLSMIVPYRKANPAIIREKKKVSNIEKAFPLQIEQMRKVKYLGSDLTIEKDLGIKNNFHQYIASYKSEGLKIFALMTMPTDKKPEKGFPVIIFNHGYIPPEQYKTTERYGAYVDSFAKNGFIVFKPDYRGNGNSEGKPEGAYYSPAYTVDVLNAVETLKNYKDANPDKIGMWGHSMGGNITLRAMVVSKDIKAGVIWGGVVASYEDMATKWKRKTSFKPSSRETQAGRPSRDSITKEFGTFETNKKFWESISPIYFVKDISGPIQLHHGLADEEVPWEFSDSLDKALINAGKEVEYYTYDGGDHNISSPNFELAISRSLDFFNKHLK